MSFIKGLLHVVFGSASEPRLNVGSSPLPHPADAKPIGAKPVEAHEFPEATIADVNRVRQEVRQRMDAERAAVEADLGLAEKSKRLERAQSYLRKADVEGIFASILEETWNWPSWKEKGALDDLPSLGLEITDVEPRVTLENNHQRHGYTVGIGSRKYDICFLDKGRGYTPDGYSNRHGEVSVSREGDTLFVCSINETGSDYTRWKLSLFGLRVLKDVSWLPDIAGFSEIVAQRANHRRKAWNDKRVIQQTSEVIDPTEK